MAKKLASFIPTPTKTFRPPLAEQRAMLEQSVTNWRRQGYDFELKILALDAQADESEDAEAESDVQKQKAQWLRQAENCYKAARALEAKLAAMPRPKQKEAKP